MGLKAGSAVLDITPVSPCNLAGYANRDHPHEDVHDPLSLRALYVKNGTDAVALVSADILWFREGIEDRIHAALERELGLSPDRVMLCGTHTHSAPTTNGPKANVEWLHFLEAQTVAAVSLAKLRAEGVALRLVRAKSEIGINRREQKPSGEIILGLNPDGPIDREMILLSVESEKGVSLAEVCSFACHGVVLGSGNYRISGDWCGLAATAIESGSTGAFLFMNGGSANVNPRLRGGPQNAFEPVEDLAAEFVKDAATARERLNEAESDEMVTGRFATVELPRQQGDVEGGMGRTRRVRIHGLRIGPVRIIGFPGEVFSETAMAVKEAFPDSAVMVNSYTTGGHAGYVPVREAYDTGGYEVRVSPYSEDAEDVLRKAFVDLVAAL